MSRRDEFFSFLESAELSDVGRRRKRNEDSVCRVPSHGVFCVADGMGGEDSGDIASQATVRSVIDALQADMPDYDVASAAAKKVRLTAGLESASQWIQRRAEQRGRGLSGSTVVVLVFDAITPKRAMTLHAGDSRIYRFRGGSLEQITRDHSLAEEAGFAKKQLPKAFRGMVTRGVGIRDQLGLEATDVDVKEKDLFILCSDGLSGMVTDRRLRKLIGRNADGSLDELARLLVQEANDSGGDDNVSVILVRAGPLKAVEVSPEPGSAIGDKPTEVTRLLERPPEGAGERDTETGETPLPGALSGGGEPAPTAETLKRKPPNPGFFARLAGNFRKEQEK